MRKIGEDVAEMLDYVPARFRVIRHVRPKLACPACERIVQVEAPVAADRARAGRPGAARPRAGLQVLPITCRCIARRRSTPAKGVELERSTMAEWVAGCFRLLDPLVEALARYVMAAQKLHADDTPVPVLDPGTRQDQDRPAVDLCAR